MMPINTLQSNEETEVRQVQSTVLYTVRNFSRKLTFPIYRMLLHLITSWKLSGAEASDILEKLTPVIFQVAPGK